MDICAKIGLRQQQCGLCGKGREEELPNLSDPGAGPRFTFQPQVVYFVNENRLHGFTALLGGGERRGLRKWHLLHKFLIFYLLTGR